VHHDLQTAKEYFDMVILLNMRLVAFGPTEQVFTPELLQKTYGGRLTILSDVAEAVANAERGTEERRPRKAPVAPHPGEAPTGL
jgi:manganese/zinc/iron transport system ATP- binding protein